MKITVLKVILITISILNSRQAAKAMKLTILIVILITISILTSRQAAKAMILTVLIVTLATISTLISRQAAKAMKLTIIIVILITITINFAYIFHDLFGKDTASLVLAEELPPSAFNNSDQYNLSCLSFNAI